MRAGLVQRSDHGSERFPDAGDFPQPVLPHKLG
jgi:hypothetical protein